MQKKSERISLQKSNFLSSKTRISANSSWKSSMHMHVICSRAVNLVEKILGRVCRRLGISVNASHSQRCRKRYGYIPPYPPFIGKQDFFCRCWNCSFRLAGQISSREPANIAKSMLQIKSSSRIQLLLLFIILGPTRFLTQSML